MNKDELLQKLKQEIEIRNFSNQTEKSYLFSVSKLLDFAKEKQLSQQLVKDYIQIEIKKKNPSTISHNIFAIQFFFDKVLNSKIFIPRPKRNKTLPIVLTIKEAKSLVNSPLLSYLYINNPADILAITN
jgi:site-specific recombinase XerD